MENKKIPRLLIISVNALRKGGSNGKVLTEMLDAWPKGKVAQFFMHDELPDFDVCENFFRVTDGDSLYSFKTGKPRFKIICEKVKAEETKSVDNSPSKAHGRNALTMLLRDMIWNSKRWQSEAFWNWIEAFRPEVILLQAGASSYIHNIAVQVAKKYNLPMAIFNTENYYLKDYNYLKGRGWDFVYPMYKWECDRAFRKLMKASSLEIYTNEVLDEQYYEAFHRHGVLIYQGSTLEPMPHRVHDIPLFTYAGNLGVNRHKPIIEIAKALQSISSDYYLDVYGRTPNDEIKEELESEKGIRYKGMVSYDEVLKVTENSDYMIHAESSDPFWIRDLNAAFSTKISDILKAGKCMILYSDKSFACSKFVARNDCACLITNKDQLVGKIKELVGTHELQAKYRENALKAADKYLDSKKNSVAFVEAITKLVK